MGLSICQFVHDVFKGQTLVDVNKTLICLIPKKEKHECVNWFQSISLCNVMYKCYETKY